MPSLLRQRVFRRYWSAQSNSMVGDQISGIALPLGVTLHASPAQVGVLTAFVWRRTSYLPSTSAPLRP